MYRITLSLLAVAALALVAIAEEKTKAPKSQIQHVPAKTGVAIALLGGEEEGGLARGFIVRATDADMKTKSARIVCPFPENETELKDYKIGLIQKFDKNGKLKGFAVLTWARTVDPENKKNIMWGPMFTEFKTIKKEKIDASFAVTLKHVWDMREKKAAKLKGMELVAMAGAKPLKAGPGVKRVKKEGKEPGETKEGEMLEYSRTLFELPADSSAETVYGVILTPKWKETRKILEGFDATLVSINKTAFPAKKK
jgi:hypothetical protein